MSGEDRTSSGGKTLLGPPGPNPHVLSLDVGTTKIKAYIYDRESRVAGCATVMTEIMESSPGISEMDEEVLWTQTQQVVKLAIQDAGLEAKDITCMGITTQRNTFITWDIETGVPFHHFITWQDLRASDLVKDWNKAPSMWFFNTGSKVMHFVTRQKRFQAGSVLKFQSAQVTMRLKWMVENNEELKKQLKNKNVRFGTIETWLLWKLTGHRVYATDYSCASSTAMYDPFQMQWSSVVLGLVGLPQHMLPPVKDTSGFFGHCDPSVFGFPIPITAVVADQQAAMFGNCCFDVGDIKCTMGTSSFIEYNTGSSPLGAYEGLYPLVGWKIGDELVYVAEGHVSDTSNAMEWAKRLSLYVCVEDTARIAQNVSDSGGVYFVPINTNAKNNNIEQDKTACCSAMVGVGSNTSKPKLLRAVLESLAFRFKLLHDTVLREGSTTLNRTIRYDGGVCNNDFVMQLMANLTQRPLDRPEHIEMTSLGAAYLAGLAAGVWQTKEELKSFRETEQVFEPKVAQTTMETFDRWKNAMR